MSAAAVFVVQGVVAGLLGAQVALAAVRAQTAPRRADGAWFTLLLCAMLALAVTRGAGPAGLLATAGLAWAAGACMAAGDGERPPSWWHAVAGLVAIGIVAGAWAGWPGTRLWLVPAVGVAALALFPLRRLCARAQAAGRGSGLPCGFGLLPVAGALTDQVVQLTGRAPLGLALLGAGAAALGSGYFLAELDYLRAPPRSHGDRRPTVPEEDGLLQHRLAIAGYLTAGVAHEFKNILGHIKTTAEWGAAGGDARRALRLIRSHVGAGVSGVTEMLTTTLREGPEARSNVSVLSEINKILGVVAATLQTARVAIRLQVPAELTLVTRRRELMLALLNLIQNAGEATSERNSAGGAVTVTGREERGLCVLEVTDAAGGVDPAVAGRLFERGYGTGSGSGLGLYLARRLVARNGGSLTYRPVPGGSSFRIALPIDPSHRSRPVAREG